MLFQLQQIPEGDNQSIRSQDTSSTVTSNSNHHRFGVSNCEALCLTADALLEEAKKLEDVGNLQVSCEPFIIFVSYIMLF